MQRGCFWLWIVMLGVALSAGAAWTGAGENSAARPPTVAGAKGKKAQPKQPMSPGEKLYQAKCGRCHDLPTPGFVAEETWNRWMMKMRYTAGLSDMDYDVMMDYARQERETRRAKMGK
jgi:cytochrome c5